jgi:uncharacterized protein
VTNARIVYLHGFNSSPQSKKAVQLHGAMSARGWGDRFACPELSHWPERAIAAIEAELKREPGGQVTLLGSSLGGFYATYLAERHDLRAVLLNPAVLAERDIANYVGPQQNLYSGERYDLTMDHVDQLRALVVPRPRPDRYWLIVETADEVLDYREACARYVGARQTVIEGGDHTLVSFPEHIDAILAFAGLGSE